MARRPKVQPAQDLAKASVLERRRPTEGFTTIPPVFHDFFQSVGKHVNLMSSLPVQVAKESAYSRFPVMVEDLPTDYDGKNLQILARQFFEPPDRHGGLLRRGDCLLMAQSLEARDEWREENERRRMAQEDSSNFAAEIATQSHFPAGHGNFFNKSNTTVRDHVQGGPDFARAILEQQKLRQEQADVASRRGGAS